MNEYLFDKGVQAYGDEMFKIAIKYFEDYLKYNPLESTAYDNIGLCYVRMKEYRKAIPYFEKAISINPRLAEAYQNMVHVYQQLGDKENAFKYYEKLLILSAL